MAEDEPPKYARLLEHYETAYWAEFSDRERYEEGQTMLENWYSRTTWEGRTVLSTEVKETFPVPFYDAAGAVRGQLPWTFIWDRCDRADNGEIEVVDYKTIMQPISPDKFVNMIQPRIYALAAAIKYPDAPAVWVSYDLLRYDVIGHRFTREENIQTWEFVKKVTRDALADPCTAERINPECRWCVRATECDTLNRHITAGGSMSIADLPTAVDRRAKLSWAQKAIETQITELDEYILEECENKGIFEFSTDHTELAVKMGARREIDSERAGQILGPELMLQYGKLQLGTIDKILKDPTIDDAKKSQLRQLIRRRPTEPRVDTKPKTPLENQ
jgi:hypothetical protein